MKVRELDIQTGDILLLRIKGITGVAVWLMQAINRDLSRWTHVGVVLDTGYVFEAQPGGATLTPLSKYADRQGAVVTHRLNGNGWLAELSLTSEQRSKISDRAREYVGRRYGWGTYLYLAMYRLGVRSKRLKCRVQRSDRMICSQAADQIYRDVGVELFKDGRMPMDVTPGDLARLAPGWNKPI